MDDPAVKPCCFGVMAFCTVLMVVMCQRITFSTTFRKKVERVIRRYALGEVRSTRPILGSKTPFAFPQLVGILPRRREATHRLWKTGSMSFHPFCNRMGLIPSAPGALRGSKEETAAVRTCGVAIRLASYQSRYWLRFWAQGPGAGVRWFASSILRVSSGSLVVVPSSFCKFWGPGLLSRRRNLKSLAVGCRLSSPSQYFFQLFDLAVLISDL